MVDAFVDSLNNMLFQITWLVSFALNVNLLWTMASCVKSIKKLVF